MRKFPKIKYPTDPATDGLLGDDVVVTEKFDGANFRFTWDEDGELYIGTRNHTYHHEDENIPKAFKHAVEYVRRRSPGSTGIGVDIASIDDIVLFGEAMHLHSLNYHDINWHNPDKGAPHVALDSRHPNVVIFDAWDAPTGEWFNWDGVESIANILGFQVAPVIARGDPEQLKEMGGFEIPPESIFGGPPEGIVIRREDGTVRAKKVTDDFNEKNAQAFNDPSKAQSDAAEFVAMFVEPARIEKVARRLVDEGRYDSLRMEMMEDLPREVLVDILEEEGWNLLCDEYGFEATFDDGFKSGVRSKTSKRCARVLKKTLNKL